MAARSYWEGAHRWEQPGYDEGILEDDVADPLTDPAAAANAFLDILTDLYLTSSISARTFCEL